jgi:hypothetical protein
MSPSPFDLSQTNDDVYESYDYEDYAELLKEWYVNMPTITTLT